MRGGGTGASAACGLEEKASVREETSPSWMRGDGRVFELLRQTEEGDARRRQEKPPGVMSGSNGANNSWTVLTPEETVAETLKPLADRTENHEESLTSAAEPDSGATQAARGEASTEGSPAEEHLVSEEKRVELIGDTSTEQHASVPSDLSDATVPASLEDTGSSAPGSDALNLSGGPPQGPAPSSPDPDSFCDSYTHMTPSSDEPPASHLTTETLGGGEFTQEEERLAEEGTVHQINGEELQQKDESDLSSRTSDLGKQADSPVDSEVGEERTERTEEEAEPEVRRRRRSLLASLDRIGRTEEEDEREEEFQVPQRDDDSGFSVNKCILAAVILLGLGTIFFSGVFMDLNEESDYGTRELKDSEAPGKQEWLNPEVPPPPVDADSTELLNKLAEGNQHISLLQAQVQAKEEELKVAKGLAAEGATERLQWEEVEKENSRLKTEMASLPVLQKENERMKRELESVLALQKELETLRSTVTELKRSSAATEATQAPVKSTTSPSSGQAEESRQDTNKEGEDRKPWKDQKEKKTDWKKEKYDTGEKKEWKEREKSEWKEGEKKERKDRGKTEWKKGKHEQGKSDKVKDKEGKQERHSDVTKQYKEKEKMKEKVSGGDEGKSWKAREGNKEWIEKTERKDRKEVKDWKKGKHDKVNEGQQEKKGWKRGKDHGEKHNGREEGNGKKEWKKVKDGFKESGKEKWESKDWKEKGENKEWKKDEWRGKHGKEGKKGERKQWEESENHSRNGKDRKMKDEKKQWKENEWKGKDDKEWKSKDEKKPWEKQEEWKRGKKEKDRNYDGKKDKSSSQKNKDEHHHDEHVWGEGKAAHTHRRPSLEQPEYWVQQRDRLQHKTKPPQQCNSLETCAKSEGLLPVPLPEFEAILQIYLDKAEEAGVDASKIEELRKLAPEFFKDGVFAHDQMSFHDFVDDVGDILEDMVEDTVEGDENGEETDSEIEEEMEEFERDVMKRFSVPAAAEKEGIQEEKRKESGRGRG
ncbi:pre-B-cell leukemia homeobox interacting protein 1b isoform X5 [Paralichthys olivaceus]|uniref:pre-B-cell leukemia homeobox interacting protein 1b isoform X5 n=1 Tax=Paralichthys olivaceus TaxID=8255 RepID=UPI00374FF58C